jgi:hypothetical protein
MSAPLYFLAGASRDTIVAASGALRREALARWRLDQVLADCAGEEDVSASEIHAKGPGGGSGVLLCAQSTGGQIPDRLGYYPDAQDWQRVEESDLWIGLDPHAPPGPDDLARRGQRVNPDGSPAAPFAGHLCRLAGFNGAGGREWEVPVVRRPDPAGTSNLPQRFVRSGGRVRGDLLPAYRAIWEETQRAVGAFFPKTEADRVVETEWSIDLAVRGLGLNYRFGWDLQNRLGLIDTTNWEAVLGALVDFPLYVAMAQALARKKNELSAEDGSPAPATSTPPGPTDA